jgi:hypothetical protein
MKTRVILACILTILLTPLSVSAKWTDPFFDLYHNTDDKIIQIRQDFYIDGKVISESNAILKEKNFGSKEV